MYFYQIKHNIWCRIMKHSISLESYVKLAKALGYSEEILQLLSEPKYDTMEELLEINKNRTRKRGV